MVTTTTVATADTMEGALMCTMSRLLTDGARKWLAAVSHATVKPGNADETRDDLSDGHLYHPRAVKQVGILLMGIIGDGMNFPIGRKRTADGALENLRRAVPEIDDSGARFHWGQLQCDIPKHDTITECRVAVLRGCKGETNCPIAQELER